ncbi:ATP-binding protein [Alicyclobacillus fastidiosus]|uniref:ATP-binding protein n=1 Tax=Alicyclobacillus fastidiosus TaxID=392011 RepID=A0ABY6ZJ88_9BACL|nr:ATP-binding protein [Alicyclobacillus fastidiosus]WAH41975.1 ATP-binding protein [Alicyclobacillus fastidiosus]GMA63704.1 ATP-binding protein [Alicyclobacillus fastidiosus]
MNEMTPKFDQSLLTTSNHERLLAFKQGRIIHPRLVTVLNTLMSWATEPVATQIVFVPGPSGVGKTTLLDVFEQKLVKHFLQQMQEDPGVIPVVRIEADPPHSNGLFSWSNFYIKILQNLNQPLAGAVTNRLRADELRRAMHKALTYRKTRVLIIDEAQSIGLVSSGRRLSDQMDNLKNLFNLTGVVIVLVGTYELLKLRELSGQIGRRSIREDFSRYHNKNFHSENKGQAKDNDLETFRDILLEFQRRLPVQTMPDFMPYFNYLYAHSIGCTGILKDWLTRALFRSLNEEGPTVTYEHLKQTALDSSICMQLINEAKYGEESFLREQALEDELLLGFDSYNPFISICG